MPVRKVYRGQLVIRDCLAQSVTSGHLASEEFAVRLVSRVMPVKMVSQDQMRQTETLVPLVMMDRKVRSVNRDRRALRELWVNQEKRVTLVRSEYLDGLESWVFRVFLDK